MQLDVLLLFQVSAGVNIAGTPESEQSCSDLCVKLDTLSRQERSVRVELVHGVLELHDFSLVLVGIRTALVSDDRNFVVLAQVIKKRVFLSVSLLDGKGLSS